MICERTQEGRDVEERLKKSFPSGKGSVRRKPETFLTEPKSPAAGGSLRLALSLRIREPRRLIQHAAGAGVLGPQPQCRAKLFDRFPITLGPRQRHAVIETHVGGIRFEARGLGERAQRFRVPSEPRQDAAQLEM